MSRRRRLSWYSRQFTTLRFCSGVWRRRSWFSLKGKAGIPGQERSRLATLARPPASPAGSVQQRGAGQTIDQTSRETGAWQRAPAAVAAVRQERERPLSARETERF